MDAIASLARKFAVPFRTKDMPEGLLFIRMGLMALALAVWEPLVNVMAESDTYGWLAFAALFGLACPALASGATAVGAWLASKLS